MTSPTPPAIALVAGECSGDLLAALLLDGLHARWPQLRSFGVGGEHMAQRGLDAWWPSEQLAVHGYSWDVFVRLAGILRMRGQLRQRLLAARPDVFVGMDAPDFNLALETDLRRAGIKTVHCVCPSIWAWRAQRVAKIRRAADHVLCLFPFEPALLARHGIAATYIGHPLASVIPMQPERCAARQRLGLVGDVPLLALLPGSRSSEIRHIAPRFLQALALIRQRLPAVQALLPTVPAQHDAVQRLVHAHTPPGAVRVLPNQSHDALAACDVALVASGTATLEAALFKRPMVIAYCMHPLNWRMLRGQQLQPWVGLPNILCKDFVVPELLQDAASPAALCDAALHWLHPSAHERTAALVQRFTALHHSLRRDTAQLAADAIGAFR